jgi:hypothetical protein
VILVTFTTGVILLVTFTTGVILGCMRLDVRVSDKGWGKERKLEVQGGWSSKKNVSRVLVPKNI